MLTLLNKKISTLFHVWSTRKQHTIQTFYLALFFVYRSPANQLTKKMQNQQEETSSLLVHQQQDREPRRNDSFDDAATFESDLQELSNVDLLSKSMDSFREPQKKHVLLEGMNCLLFVTRNACRFVCILFQIVASIKG